MDIVEQLNKSIANLREAGFDPTLLEAACDEIVMLRKGVENLEDKILDLQYEIDPWGGVDE
tara:strand:- start:354 stop:536 length:183 start_codon:yes stop_codon:yes gene_type:complete